MSNLKFFFLRLFSPRIRFAFRECRRDKGYVSLGDWQGIQTDDHWTLRRYDELVEAFERIGL